MWKFSARISNASFEREKDLASKKRRVYCSCQGLCLRYLQAEMVEFKAITVTQKPGLTLGHSNTACCIQNPNSIS